MYIRHRACKKWSVRMCCEGALVNALFSYYQARGRLARAYTCIHSHTPEWIHESKESLFKGVLRGGSISLVMAGWGVRGGVVERRVRCRLQKSSSRDKISGNALSTGRHGRGGARTHQFSQRGG